MKHGKSTKILAIVALLMLRFSISVSAEETKTVEIHLPTFNVWINGVLVNNLNSRYPFFVYNDITYFPMTWMDSRFLGLEATWNEKNGLTVKKTTKFEDYRPYDTALNNPDLSYSAEIVNRPVHINDKNIDNGSEPYPLLSFRDVTYFPLTWRYAVDEFGWSYFWGPDEGLKIDTPNPKKEENTKYTLLSVINSTAFGKGYEFHTSGVLNNGAEAFAFNGRVENDYRDSEFVSTVKLQNGFPFLTASISQWGWVYEGVGSDFENLPGANVISSGSYSLTTASAFLSSPYTAINRFQILGDMRESINECIKIADDRYLLSFNGNSKWADLTLEMKFNPKTMNLVELIITDNDPQYGKYKIVEDIQ